MASSLSRKLCGAICSSSRAKPSVLCSLCTKSLFSEPSPSQQRPLENGIYKTHILPFRSESYAKWVPSRAIHSQRNFPSAYSEMKKEYKTWELIELGIPHLVHREAARQLLEIAFFRLQNDMASLEIDDFLFSDLIKELMDCATPTELVDTLKKKLKELFPLDMKNPNTATMAIKFRDHFFGLVDSIGQSTATQSTAKTIRILTMHPLLCSLEERTRLICHTADAVERGGLIDEYNSFFEKRESAEAV